MRTLISAAMVMGLLLIFGCAKAPEEKAKEIGTGKDSARVIAVDDLASHPEEAKGRLAVNGTVAEVLESRSGFLLGCEDACVSLPVTFKGTMPIVGSEVTVYGVVAKADSEKYVLIAEEVKSK